MKSIAHPQKQMGAESKRHMLSDPKICANSKGLSPGRQSGSGSATYSVSKSFVSRREAAGSAVARQGGATTTRMI
jgi:hypothetical protein